MNQKFNKKSANGKNGSKSGIKVGSKIKDYIQGISRINSFTHQFESYDQRELTLKGASRSSKQVLHKRNTMRDIKASGNSLNKDINKDLDFDTSPQAAKKSSFKQISRNKDIIGSKIASGITPTHRNISFEEHKSFQNVESKLKSYIMAPSKNTKEENERRCSFKMTSKKQKNIFKKLRYSFNEDLGMGRVLCQVTSGGTSHDQGSHSEETGVKEHSDYETYIKGLISSQFAVFLYTISPQQMDQSTDQVAEENIDEKYEVYSIQDFYKNKVKNIEKEEDLRKAKLEYIIMKYDSNRAQWVSKKEFIQKPTQFSDSLLLTKFLRFQTNGSSQSANTEVTEEYEEEWTNRCGICRIKRSKTTARWLCIDPTCNKSSNIFETCHNDFINRTENHPRHTSEHEMVLLRYCNKSECWKILCKFSSQERYLQGDVNCVICHISLKQRKAKYTCQDCIVPSTGLFRNYCYDHKKQEFHLKTPHSAPKRLIYSKWEKKWTPQKVSRKDKKCSFCDIQNPKDNNESLLIVLTHTSQYLENLTFCVDHYLSVEVPHCKYEGYDTIEIWKKTKTWKKISSDKSFQEIYQISDFLDILVKPEICGRILFLKQEFNFIKYTEKSQEHLEFSYEIAKKDLSSLKLLLCTKLAFQNIQISPSISLPSQECGFCIIDPLPFLVPESLQKYTFLYCASEPFSSCIFHYRKIEKLLVDSEKLFNVVTEVKFCQNCCEEAGNEVFRCMDCYKKSVPVMLCGKCWKTHDKTHFMVKYEGEQVKWGGRLFDEVEKEKYQCLKCPKYLTDHGIAINFKVSVKSFAKTSKIENDFMICLEDFDDLICTKLEALYPSGRYSISEWVLQYDRQQWRDIIDDLSKEEVRKIISHMQNINKGPRTCNICEAEIDTKIWACMDEFCINLKNSDTPKSSCQSVHSILICENHFSLSLTPQTSINNGHKMMCFTYSKIQTGAGLVEKYMPKNSFKFLPHLLQKRIFYQTQVLNGIGDDLGNFGKFGSDQNDGHSLQKNIEMLGGISVDFGSDQSSIGSEYKHPAPGYEYLIGKEDSLENVNLEDLEKSEDSWSDGNSKVSEEDTGIQPEDILSDDIELEEGELSDENFEIELA